jgi:hypothetical protein
MMKQTLSEEMVRVGSAITPSLFMATDVGTRREEVRFHHPAAML